MDGAVTYLPINEEPPGRKLGHYKLRKPVVMVPLPSEHQVVVDRLVKEIENETLYGKIGQ